MWLEGYADYPAIADDGVKDYFHSTSFRYVKISPFLDIDYEIDAVEILKLAHIQISVDIKPQSCPNPVNVNAKGVLPVAILGTADKVFQLLAKM